MEKIDTNYIDLEEATIKHEFSSPWDDSDLVLVVEKQHLHVHRTILKMASPVFKAMLSSDFKEREAAEIPLPGKDVYEFIDLLRQIYPQIESEITLDNVEHIYKLADEYQIQAIGKACQHFLRLVPKNRANVMRILVSAQTCDADDVRQKCYKKLQELTVAEMKNCTDFEELDEESLRKVVLQKAERLEGCLSRIQPQLVGLIDFVLFLWPSCEGKISYYAPQKCPLHYKYSMPPTDMKTRIKCDVCKDMIISMAKNSYDYRGKPHCSEIHFDENIITVLEEMFHLLTT